MRWRSWHPCLSAFTFVSLCVKDEEASYNKVGRASKCCSFHTSALSLTLPYIVLHNKWFHARWAAGWVYDTQDEADEEGSAACERLHLHQSDERNELKMNRKRWAKWHILHHQLFHKVFLFGSCKEKSLWGKRKSHTAWIHATVHGNWQTGSSEMRGSKTTQAHHPVFTYHQDKLKHIVYLQKSLNTWFCLRLCERISNVYTN